MRAVFALAMVAGCLLVGFGGRFGLPVRTLLGPTTSGLVAPPSPPATPCGAVADAGVPHAGQAPSPACAALARGGRRPTTTPVPTSTPARTATPVPTGTPVRTPANANGGSVAVFGVAEPEALIARSSAELATLARRIDYCLHCVAVTTSLGYGTPQQVVDTMKAANPGIRMFGYAGSMDMGSIQGEGLLGDASGHPEWRLRSAEGYP